ncbi:MAG: hypothetical protein L0338_08835 [Acidobacteria bacterium]|nr:hypothetical protein [Acidobacteriota bacterium]
MKNAHERFGFLEFTKRVKETTTRIRVHMDRLIAEPTKENRGPAAAHLLSVLGSDAEIAAVWAAVTEGAFFQILLPDRPAFAASLGQEAQCFRGSVAIQGRNRPVRHLVALSAELLKTRPGADRDGKRTILFDGDPTFVLYRLSRRFGLPVVPDWASWFMRELEKRKAIQPLFGLGCSPVLVKGAKERFLGWIGKALKQDVIRIPGSKGAHSWKLPRGFIEPGITDDASSAVTPRETVLMRPAVSA